MDLIYAARYTEVCDYAWHDCFDHRTEQIKQLDLPSGIWHVDTSAVDMFFSIIKRPENRSRKYVVVSPSCDFGVCLQAYNHPALDFEKWIGLQLTPQTGYDSLPPMPARINPNRCNESDKYSCKCWSYTAATFPEIPDNVTKWFLANCEIDDERVVPIPFGIVGNKNDLDNAKKIDNYTTIQPRDKLLYVNFQFYTTDRFRLYAHFKTIFGHMVTCKQSCPFDEFLEDMATHKYVLCPPGNGLDCYRTLETIYMGAVPILEGRGGCAAPYKGIDYPVLVYPNLFMCDPRGLDQLYTQIVSRRNLDSTKAKWPYWRDQILSCYGGNTMPL